MAHSFQGSRYSLKTLKSPGIEKAFLRALEKPLKITKMLKILEKSLNLNVLFVDLSFLNKKTPIKKLTSIQKHVELAAEIYDRWGSCVMY